MKKLILLFTLLITACTVRPGLSQVATSEPLKTYTETITPQFLQKHLEVIAHDSLEGRATGMRGQKIAADYLSNYYNQLGLKPVGDNNTYFQHFRLNAEYTDSLIYKINRVNGSDTLSVSRSVESKDATGDFIRMFGGGQPLNGDIIFAGFGLNDPEREVFHLDGAEIANNWVLIFEEIPYVANGDTLINPNINSNSRISTILGQYDAAGILLISDYTSDEFNELASISSGLISNPSNLSLEYLDQNQRSGRFPKGVIQVSPEKALQILNAEQGVDLNTIRDNLTTDIKTFRAEKTSFLLDYTPYDGPGYIESENVVAFFEGADPDVKDEVLVLMAHYDHVGISQPDDRGDSINNGADDNGSGTVALMTIANALTKAKQDGYYPRRSVLFLHVAGEELGLLGSRYYSDHPIIPIENTVTNFNADMIGRSDSRNIEKDDTDYVYLIGGEIISSELDSLVQLANNKSVNMRLDRYYNDLQDRNQFYRRSDHWNFGRLGVPFVFFFTGVHEDYHRPSDTIDKIDFEKLARVTKLIYSSSIEVLNYEGRPSVDNEEFIQITRRLPR